MNEKFWHCKKCHYMDCSCGKHISIKHVSHRGVDIGNCQEDMQELIDKSLVEKAIDEVERELGPFIPATMLLKQKLGLTP